MRYTVTSSSRRSRKARSAAFISSASACAVRVCCFGAPVEPAQEVGARGVKQMVLRQVDPLDKLEAELRPVSHCDGHGTVQLDDRRRLEARELVVERSDLEPVRLALLDVERGDRGLQLVAPRLPVGERALEHAGTFGDPLEAPARAVLILEQHDRAVGCGACVAPGVVQAA